MIALTLLTVFWFVGAPVLGALAVGAAHAEKRGCPPAVADALQAILGVWVRGAPVAAGLVVALALAWGAVGLGWEPPTAENIEKLHRGAQSGGP